MVHGCTAIEGFEYLKDFAPRIPVSIVNVETNTNKSKYKMIYKLEHNILIWFI